ncbi:hypothetical protein BDV3_005489 [Batrachochytrium dendrobatidis]
MSLQQPCISPYSIALLVLVRLALDHQLYGPLHVSDLGDQHAQSSDSADNSAFTTSQILLFLGDCLDGDTVLKVQSLDTLLARLQHTSKLQLYIKNDTDFQSVPFLAYYKQQCLDLSENYLGLKYFLNSMDLFRDNEDDLSDQNITESSPIGLFVNKNIAAFQTLELDGWMVLNQQYEAFCKGESLDDIDMIGLTDSIVEQYIDSQVKLFEKSSGLPTPHDIQQELQHILKCLSNLAKSHYLSYLNHLRSGEIYRALEDLRRFIDYSVVGDTNKIPFQYVSLNMAAVHSEMGQHMEALEFVSDALRYARFVGDDTCLSYILMWLDRLTWKLGRDTMCNKYGNMPNEEEILDTLAERTQRFGQHQLQVLSHLRNATWRLMNGKSPILVFHSVQIATSLVNHHRGLEALVSTVELTKAGIWEIYGNTQSARAAIQQVLIVNQKEYSANDLSMAYSKNALYEASEGRFKEAFSLIKTAKQRFPIVGFFEASKHWLVAMGYILLDRALFRLNMPLAAHILANLSAHCIDTPHNNQAIKIYGARLAKRYGKRDEAYRLFMEASEPPEEGVIEGSLNYIPAMLEQADLLLEEGREGAIAALPITLKCLALADQYSMNLIRIMGLVRLSHILVHLQYFRQALDLITELLPSVLVAASAVDRGYTYFVHAQILIAAMAGSDRPITGSNATEPFTLLEKKAVDQSVKEATRLAGNNTDKRIVTSTLHSMLTTTWASVIYSLKEAEKCYINLASVYHLERCYHLMSLAYNRAGLIAERNEACKKMRALCIPFEVSDDAENEQYTWEYQIKH